MSFIIFFVQWTILGGFLGIILLLCTRQTGFYLNPWSYGMADKYSKYLDYVLAFLCGPAVWFAALTTFWSNRND